MAEQAGSQIMVNTSMAPQGDEAIRCRPIELADLAAITALLVRGFPERDQSYWERGLLRLRDRDLPEGYPRFGFMLTAGGRPVGVLLLLFSIASDVPAVVRCNVSSWYVEPLFRPYAALLVSAALRSKDVTYTNMTAAPHTWPILQAQGYRRYSQGQAFVLPLLTAPAPGVTVRQVTGEGDAVDGLDRQTVALLRRHAGYGCLSLVCDTDEGASPFIFVRRSTVRNWLPAAQLVYCRDVAELRRFAGNIGRFLIRRGIVIAVVDAADPRPGLVGIAFREKAPRFARGANPPAASDLADTELVIFGP